MPNANSHNAFFFFFSIRSLCLVFSLTRSLSLFLRLYFSFFFPLWLRSYLANAILFHLHVVHVCNIHHHQYTSFSKLSLFLMHIYIYDWNEPSTKWEWMMRMLMRKRMDTACKIICHSAIHTQSHTDTQAQAQTHHTFPLIFGYCCFLFVWLPFQN